MFTPRKSFGGRSGGRSGPGGRSESSGGRGGYGGGQGRGGEGRGGRDFQEGREGRGGKFFRKKSCRFCEERVSLIDFKEMDRLTKFMTEKGKIIPQRISGNCAKHQRMLSRAVKRARHAALVPFQAA